MGIAAGADCQVRPASRVILPCAKTLPSFSLQKSRNVCLRPQDVRLDLDLEPRVFALDLHREVAVVFQANRRLRARHTGPQREMINTGFPTVGRDKPRAVRLAIPEPAALLLGIVLEAGRHFLGPNRVGTGQGQFGSLFGCPAVCRHAEVLAYLDLVRLYLEPRDLDLGNAGLGAADLPLSNRDLDQGPRRDVRSGCRSIVGICQEPIRAVGPAASADRDANTPGAESSSSGPLSSSR